jgi:DNA-binding beta-propeller fold protein YncE
VRVISGFNGPGAISLGGSHVWVANSGGFSVIELSASTGALVRVITGSSYGFYESEPFGITSAGTHIWVTDGDGNSVTELSASTGALVRVISGSSYGFKYPTAISSAGTHIWVTDGDGNSVTELSASTGALAAPVNPNEADSSRVHCGVATTSSSGSLIQTAWGGAGGVGTLRTKRSGCAA